MALRFLCVTIFDAFRTASLVPARRGVYNAMILTSIGVVAGKTEQAVVAIAFGVYPD